MLSMLIGSDCLMDVQKYEQYNLKKYCVVKNS